MSSIETGFCLHTLTREDAKRVVESGAQWIRIDASNDLGPSIAVAKSHNLKVLAILGSWMFNRSSKFSIEEWQSNVTNYVSKHAKQVDAWEIWNEPSNVSYPLLDLPISGPEYAKNLKQIAQFYFSMVKIASPIIKQYNPQAKILLLGGLNLFSGGDRHLALDKELASQLAAINVQQYGDAISIHAYPWMNRATQVVWDNYRQSLQFYQNLLNSNLEIWVTETGQPVNADGEAGQATYLKSALDFFSGKATHLFWYSLYDNSWEDKQFGLFDNNGRQRLAYGELKSKLARKESIPTWKVTVNAFEGTNRTINLNKTVTVKDPDGTVLFTKTTPFTERLKQTGWHNVSIEQSEEFDRWEGPNGWTSPNTTFGLNPKEDNTFKIIYKEHARFPLKVGVSVFGTPSYFSIQSALSEFKTFVEANSKFNIQIITGSYPPLAHDEFHPLPGPGGFKFVDPWYVHPETLAKLPLGVAVQIAIYDIQSTTINFGGRTYQPSPQTRNIPFIAIPFGNSIKWWPVEPNWKTRTATALVHEFYHAIAQILQQKGHTLPDPDKATAYGYTVQNDPGWVRFDKFLYGQITDQMYKALTQ